MSEPTIKEILRTADGINDKPMLTDDEMYVERLKEVISHEVNMSTDYLSNTEHRAHIAVYRFDAKALVQRLVTAVLSVQP